MLIVYAVVYSNLYPREIDSLWTTEELAEKRTEVLHGDWRVNSLMVLDENSIILENETPEGEEA